MKNDFKTVWGRIKDETNLKSFNDLGELIGKTQQTISYAKKKEEFPADWAYLVACAYGLFTEWIMTGEGQKKIAVFNEEKRTEKRLKIISEIEEWINEEIKKNPKKKDWFEIEVEEKFPGFKKWKQRKENREGDSSEFPNSKAV